jgi:hypothetical protein
VLSWFSLRSCSSSTLWVLQKVLVFIPLRTLDHALCVLFASCSHGRPCPGCRSAHECFSRDDILRREQQLPSQCKHRVSKFAYRGTQAAVCLRYGLTLALQGGGSGTYHDPITFAAATAAFPAGTVIYSFELEKYFIMEDGCDECEQDHRSGRYHVDIWTGCAQVFC